MQLAASIEKRIFHFFRPAGTSRGVLNEKKSWFIYIWDENEPAIKGIGECSVIPGLSPDYLNDSAYEEKLKEVVLNIEKYSTQLTEIKEFPSILFGLEMALLDFKNGGKRIYYDSAFTRGEKSIPINGLIWMGDPEFIKDQIKDKISEGFSCIKMKIGAIDFSKELEILEEIRKNYSSREITLRVDANGAFTPPEAMAKLTRLSEYDLHSIEQPIKQGQWREMKKLCESSPVPIALDEELIGLHDIKAKTEMLDKILPQFIILKLSLVGGFHSTREWIELAEERKISWWITSALESNIGLDAIAQFTSTYDIELPQGLGTGMLYKDNVPSELRIENGCLKRLSHG
ncbi:MAG: o-succinylbenzoate synthase [Brumimicrobium sp.]|nr:o-succinylbenzoate synthase [Brumimicrobium sp.]